MNRKQRRIAQAKLSAVQSPGGSALDDFRQAVLHLQKGQLHQSEQAHRRVLARTPRHAPSLHHLGLIAFKGADRSKAVDYIRQSVAIDPAYHQAWLNLAVILGELNRVDEAIDACRRCMALQPANAEPQNVLGNLLRARQNMPDAAAAYAESLKLKPDQPVVLVRLGELFLDLGKSDEALTLCRRARTLDPSFVDAKTLERRILAETGQLQAVEALVEGGSSDPKERAQSYDELGTFLVARGRHAEAVAVLRRAMADAPGSADAHFNLAMALDGAGQSQEALATYRAGLAIDPDRAEAYAMMGVLLRGMSQHAAAINALQISVKLDPSLAVGHYNLAVTYKALGRFEEALEAFRKAVEYAPDSLVNRFEFYSLRRLICDWEGLEGEEWQCRELFRQRNAIVAPFQFIPMDASRAEQQEAGRRFAPKTIVAEEMRRREPRSARDGDGRIRIGYLSSDFFEHATSMLLVEVLERTDRSRFELFAYCYSPDDGSDLRRRVMGAFDHFVDIKRMSHQEAARKIHADGIDILVDLKGYTLNARTQILAYRPAPIQVNYLGYPATMGVDFVDYILADPVVAPMQHQEEYTERIVHLPHCYQPNDKQRKISEEPITRADCGLPDDAFVFCSFNNSYKLKAPVFDVWMRLLGKVPRSVLWLLSSNSLCRDNLRREAAARGVDPDRLVFAERFPIARHLARHALADLFLDSTPCNAHTTASDALWAGLPVLTCLGETFAGRVAASLLAAMDLNELIAENLEAYERIALSLAQDKSGLDRVRQKIAVGRETAPLFDSTRYARNLEAAYQTMVDIMRSGEGPQPFAVEDNQGAGDRVEQQPTAGEHVLPAKLLEPRVVYDCCPLCDARDIPYQVEAKVTQHALYKPQLPPTMKWRGCAGCGHVFVEGYYTPEACEIVFSATHANQKVGSDIEGQRKVSARIVERIARYAPSGDWLDIGVGNGSLLFTAAEWGYRAAGTDLRTENVALLQKLGFEAHCKDIEEIEAADRFSVVSMADVLEHVPYPRRALAAVHKMMKKGGALFVSMPNMDTIVWRTLDASGANPYWGELEHYHNFTRARLVKLLEAHGFKFAEYNISERYRTCMEVVALKV